VVPVVATILSAAGAVAGIERQHLIGSTAFDGSRRIDLSDWFGQGCRRETSGIYELQYLQWARCRMEGGIPGDVPIGCRPTKHEEAGKDQAGKLQRPRGPRDKDFRVIVLVRDGIDQIRGIHAHSISLQTGWFCAALPARSVTGIHEAVNKLIG
jgi:hypothetical protein